MLVLRPALFAAAAAAVGLVAAACGQSGAPAAASMPPPAPATATAPAPTATRAAGPLVAAAPVSAVAAAVLEAAPEGAPMPPLLPPPVPWGLPPASPGTPPPAISAVAALVMDEASGAILFEQNAALSLPPASLTKIATAVAVIEAGYLETPIEANPDLERQWLEDSQSMGLEPGDVFLGRELLYGLLLASGNDAAEALAIAVDGGIEPFAARLNALAARLGLTGTHFVNPHGLEAPGHVSTARDMALLARYAMSLPDFRAIVATESHTAVGSRELPLYNLNPLLNYTEGVDGVKTGYTEEAGRTFVVTATRGGHRVIVVLLNDLFRTPDAIALIDWAFAAHTWPPG